MKPFENCTSSSDFILSGFINLKDFKIPLFFLFLFIYLIILIENTVIIVLVSTSGHLQTPMYFILKCLSFCELIYVTNLVPKMMHDLLSEPATIPVIGCIIQLQIYSTTGNTTSLHYALMSYDRYSAISDPLRYSTIINTRFCRCWVIAFWLTSFTFAITISFFLRQLVFCDSNIINHFHCDLNPMVELASTDTRLLLLTTAIFSSLILMVPLLFVVFSYIFIIYTILNIPTATGRKKAFSTCSSHLFVVTITYSIILSMYMLPRRATTPQTGSGIKTQQGIGNTEAHYCFLLDNLWWTL
ncbi:hypothetical protein GDO81_001951 [Engystomops pustulosus]|uniref:G-protein coupled receptors family 1 profile domain-containing protein n=1 Tax=Engystomops pustulosus TaxID=76066 RepID=A0AAV7DH51_ENGPU|nr:hypothetical protein GDO81_001951 [Engystomops pustulosus]